LAGFPVWAKGTSTVGAGAESKAVEVGKEVNIEGVKVVTVSRMLVPHSLLPKKRFLKKIIQ